LVCRSQGPHLGPLLDDAELVVHPQPLQQEAPDARLDPDLALPPDLGVATLPVHRVLEREPPRHEIEDDEVEGALREEVRGYGHVPGIVGTAA
jgi:hypothetical protein